MGYVKKNIPSDRSLDNANHIFLGSRNTTWGIRTPEIDYYHVLIIKKAGVMVPRKRLRCTRRYGEDMRPGFISYRRCSRY